MIIQSPMDLIFGFGILKITLLKLEFTKQIKLIQYMNQVLMLMMSHLEGPF